VETCEVRIAGVEGRDAVLRFCMDGCDASSGGSLDCAAGMNRVSARDGTGAACLFAVGFY
jgi:hypothetical protein